MIIGSFLFNSLFNQCDWLRYAIERMLNGISKVKPLKVNDFLKPLGPGYKRGWYAPKNYGGRRANCKISSNLKKWKELKSYDRKIKKALDKNKSLDKTKTLGEMFEGSYHGKGHNIIAQNCQTPGTK